MKAFDTFIELVKDQFTYGGKKYALDDKRESTDILFDNHGKNWLFGTIDKYTFRYKNLERERDLLKIATYMYIIWLKRGYFLQERGVDAPIDTNIKIKTEEFDNFVGVINNYYSKFQPELKGVENRLGLISDILAGFSSIDWVSVLENHLAQVFCLTFEEWLIKYSRKKKHDTDTWNNEAKNETTKV
jgi:hypothetical protein